MKFRKKPVVIEAMQLTNKTILQVYEFIHGENSVQLTCRSAEDYWDTFEDIVKRDGLKLKTLESGEGTQIASIGDWIIKGVQGEFYPCKPDIFEKTYEPVD
jgi:hypothetical protein